MFECSAMVSNWSRCEVGGEFIRATRLGNKQLPHRIHLCILAHDSSGSLLPPRPSTPPGAIRELRCPSIWLSSIGFRVIGRRIEERGDEEGYWEAPHLFAPVWARQKSGSRAHNGRMGALASTLLNVKMRNGTLYGLADLTDTRMRPRRPL